jgi:hypothetical protein
MTSVATQHKSADSAALIAECRVAAVLILYVVCMKQNRNLWHRIVGPHGMCRTESELRGTLRPLPVGQATGTTSHLTRSPRAHMRDASWRPRDYHYGLCT